MTLKNRVGSQFDCYFLYVLYVWLLLLYKLRVYNCRPKLGPKCYPAWISLYIFMMELNPIDKYSDHRYNKNGIQSQVLKSNSE